MKKILIIEDVDWNRDLLVQILEEDFEVVEAEDGRSGTTLDTGRPGDWSVGHENDPEVPPMNRPQNADLIAGAKALEAAGIAIALVMRVPAPLKSIADQVIRAASSVPATLVEGDGRTGRDRFHHWRIAYGSAKEVDCHLRLLLQTGAVNQARTETALALFDEVRAMTWRLLHPEG